MVEVGGRLRMTHNEYMEFDKRNLDRLRVDPNYSMADYKRDAERVEIIGFDLDRFEFSPGTRNFIDKTFSTDTADRYGNVMLQEYVRDREVVSQIAEELGCVLAWDNGYGGFFRNDDWKCILAFCRGDLSLVLCEDEEAYRKAVEGYNRFYHVKDKGGLRSLDEQIRFSECVSKKDEKSVVEQDLGAR